MKYLFIFRENNIPDIVEIISYSKRPDDMGYHITYLHKGAEYKGFIFALALAKRTFHTLEEAENAIKLLIIKQIIN